MSDTVATRDVKAGIGSLSLVEAVVWGLILLVGISMALVLHERRVTDEMTRLSQAREMVRALNAALLLPRPGDVELPGTTEGLQALVADGTLERIPDDPWGRPYVYRNPGRERNYELLSLGPDGVESADDVVHWNLYGGRAVITLGGAGNPPRPRLDQKQSKEKP
ncbi:MAG TPA: type II secretion system protein GspG [Thiobacillaceae bacterium]|nr:type II secretion system protein GspG [Thiobacillaceae bacterium]HNU64152.1 type II secretion system protein GspG [Thiobacillaceae bacterium]